MKPHKLHSLFLTAFFAVTSLLLFSCSDGHLIKDSAMRRRVQEDFDSARAQNGGDLYEAILRDDLTTEEREGLQFLYAYMPFSDVADYSVDFHLANVRTALQARKEMPWGKRIPDREFLHFVLPPRVNNEPLDSSRAIFYNELRDRIVGLSMHDAVLEINHWCRQKVTYAPSDGRTHSPLETVYNALGRCGEQSTFAVAALRAMGIPARQVYTPRWAHTDDNHAWVEVWVDGEWHFLGGSEPAANLDIAWFNGAASRAMFVHAKVFGRYEGNEEIISTERNTTTINCTAHYTPTHKAEVVVKNADGSPSEGALVHFCVYNYAEFYPVATLRTNGSGYAGISTGHGDLFVWAEDEKRQEQAFDILPADLSKPAILRLTPEGNLPDSLEFKLTPPHENAIPVRATDEEIASCDKRIAMDDSIRHAYEATFATPTSANEAAKKWALDPTAVGHLFTTARANARNLYKFLDAQPSERRKLAFDFLHVLSEKDWTDIPLPLLEKLFAQVPTGATQEELLYQYSPRVAYEPLRDWRTVAEEQPFVGALVEDELWLANTLQILADCQRDGGYPSPLTLGSLLKYKRGDKRSMEIALVQLARTRGLFSRYNATLRVVEISFDRGKTWQAYPLDTPPAEQPKGEVAFLSQTDKANSIVPKYYSHFSLAHIKGSSLPQTLYFDEEGPLEVSDLFAKPMPLAIGRYYLIAGTRMASGAVKVRMQRFQIERDSTTTLSLTLPQDANELSVLGSINVEQPYCTLQGEPTKEEKMASQSLISTTGRGFFILAILEPGTEPTNHVLKDLERVEEKLNIWGRPFVFLFPSSAAAKSFKASEFPRLPKASHYGVDQDGTIRQMIYKATNRERGSLPLVVIADSFGRVVFIHEGYTIGIGDQIVATLPKLE